MYSWFYLVRSSSGFKNLLTGMVTVMDQDVQSTHVGSFLADDFRSTTHFRRFGVSGTWLADESVSWTKGLLENIFSGAILLHYKELHGKKEVVKGFGHVDLNASQYDQRTLVVSKVDGNALFEQISANTMQQSSQRGMLGIFRFSDNLSHILVDLIDNKVELIKLWIDSQVRHGLLGATMHVCTDGRSTTTPGMGLTFSRICPEVPF
mmetsp:Transcript_6642/g.16753  ORF Transcript_6642/g.16753 Transcript_6642/m.16753 type:complete len:207 (+) Transcript_6642:24-644(+)